LEFWFDGHEAKDERDVTFDFFYSGGGGIFLGNGGLEGMKATEEIDDGLDGSCCSSIIEM
jgi:hypothetical protein